MTKIDDAMIERASAVFCMQTTYPIRKEIARAMLEAALQPPEEIPDPNPFKPGRNQDTWQIEHILLAILDHLKTESARRAEAGKAAQSNSLARNLLGEYAHRRQTDWATNIHPHRRKDDPK